MKTISNIFMIMTVAILASCMADSYDAPDLSESPYGNTSLTETNIITIAQLKDAFKSTIANNGMKEVTDDIKITGTVIGNDIEGNIYNEVIIDDGTGAFIVCINQGGLFGYLPVGQKILIDLNGNYYDRIYLSYSPSYRYQGTLTTMGRVNNDGTYDVPEQAKGKGGFMLDGSIGKTLRLPHGSSVTLTANCANRNFKEFSSSRLVLRTSSYADFAGNVMPTGKVDVTGIFTRYRDTWQILMRTTADIQPAQ